MRETEKHNNKEEKKTFGKTVTPNKSNPKKMHSLPDSFSPLQKEAHYERYQGPAPKEAAASLASRNRGVYGHNALLIRISPSRSALCRSIGLRGTRTARYGERPSSILALALALALALSHSHLQHAVRRFLHQRFCLPMLYVPSANRSVRLSSTRVIVDRVGIIGIVL